MNPLTTKKHSLDAGASLHRILLNVNLIRKIQEQQAQRLFSKFRQYEEFLAYVLVKTGSLYCLLHSNQAEIGGKEVEKQYARILDSSEVWKKSKHEIANRVRR